MEVSDDEEVPNFATRPYSIMPTVLELQQMRNRLHVAQAGKEMMRWNSSCTGVEMRKISSDLQAVYSNFGREMRRAFLLLARCRYFNEDFYRNVIESVKSASINVHCTFKDHAGVTMLSCTPLEISNTKVCKCPVPCRGGQAIQEAKKAWSNLLRSHIKMVELRTNFKTIESAYRNSTKRLNIINQIVLPKTQATINYILVQLEEITREESHRIRVKLTKLRNRSSISCGCSSSEFSDYKPTKYIQEEKGKKHFTPHATLIREILPPDVNMYEVQSEVVNGRKDQPTNKDVSQVIDIYEPMIEQKSRHRICSLINFYKYVSASTESLLMEVPKQRMSLGDFDSRKYLPKIDKATYAMDKLLEACKLTRDRLSTFASNEKPCQVDSEIKVPLGQLKSHIDAVIQANIRLQSSAFIAKSVKHFIESCEVIDENLKYAIKGIDISPLDINGKKRIQHLIRSIDDVVQIITDYRSEGFITPSLEEFSRVCAETKVKVGFYNIKHDLQKIDYLKSYISNLELLTADITRDCVKTPSIQNFLTSCKCFREKLEEHKQQRKRQHINEHKLIKSLKKSQKAETDVALTESVQQFISSCENVMRRIQRNDSAMKVVDSYYTKNFVSLMTNLRSQGLLSKSTIAFLTAKSKTYKFEENNDDSCQSYTSESLSESNNKIPTARVEEKENKIENIIPKNEVKEDYIANVTKLLVKEGKSDERVRRRERMAAKIRHNFSKIIAKVKENIPRSDRKSEFDDSKSTSNPSKKGEGNEDHGSTCSFEISEVSDPLCSNSSCTRSDMIVAEINTYDSCPILKAMTSNTWDSKSSDSWTKPLLPKVKNCVMCSSQFSLDSSEKQVCKECARIHEREEIIKALENTYTM